MLQIPSFVIAAFVLPLCLSFYFALLSLSCLPLALFPLSSILLSHLMLYLLVGRFWKTASMVVVSYYDFGGGGWQRVPSVVSSGIVWLLWLLWLRMVVTGRWWERYPFSLNYSLTHSLSTPGCPCLAGYSFGLNFVLKGKKNDGCANTLNLKKLLGTCFGDGRISDIFWVRKLYGHQDIRTQEDIGKDIAQIHSSWNRMEDSHLAGSEWGMYLVNSEEISIEMVSFHCHPFQKHRICYCM
ncbi:hypothetical protein B0T09DRAFT_20690 [Sordaria sp. MPI-SDFR-AT-0083]|nr:hypothetical protein B0T09DRAFT_20690 [Sordaria sp. MPI-SDFR-AT-0083]